MTLEEIKTAVGEGKKVCWTNDNYEIVPDQTGELLIYSWCTNSYIGLTWINGETLNGREEDFYIKDEG